MFKLITFAILSYLLYKVVVEPKKLNKQADKPNINDAQAPKKEPPGEFIDYEEVQD